MHAGLEDLTTASDWGIDIISITVEHCQNYRLIEECGQEETHYEYRHNFIKNPTCFTIGKTSVA